MEMLVNKIESVHRCLGRIREEYNGDRLNLQNYSKQDAIVLNLLRVSELMMDIANMTIAAFKLSLPRTNREAFDILEAQGIINREMAKTMAGMAGFRNIAVHDYRSMNLAIVENILQNRLDDFRAFAEAVLEYWNTNLTDDSGR